MSGSVEEGGPRTPPLGTALTLLLGVALLFLLVGVPLQLFLGEGGLVLSQIGLLLLPAVLFVRVGRFDLVETFSLRLPSGRQLLGGLLVLLGGVQCAWILTWLQSLVLPVPTAYLEAMATVLTADSFGRYLWLLFMAAFLPAIAEEALFRGVVLSGFRSRLPALGAVVGVGVVFGLFHLTPETAFRFLPTAWLGALFASVVVASGSLPLASILHFLNNAAILTFTALPLTRERLTAPNEAPPLLLIPIAIGLVVWGMNMLRPAVDRPIVDRTGVDQRGDP